MSNESKEIRLFNEYLEFISSDEHSEAYLKSEGLDPEALVDETVRRAKLVRMRLAAQKTEEEYRSLQSNLLQKARQEVERLLSDVSFSLESFLKREQLNVAYKNFEGMSPTQVREFLEKHFLLKLEAEQRTK